MDESVKQPSHTAEEMAEEVLYRLRGTEDNTFEFVCDPESPYGGDPDEVVQRTGESPYDDPTAATAVLRLEMPAGQKFEIEVREI